MNLYLKGLGKNSLRIFNFFTSLRKRSLYTFYSTLYERHHEFAKMQAARERKANRPQDGGKREFRGGKPTGDKRGQRPQRFSKPNPNKSRGDKK